MEIFGNIRFSDILTIIIIIAGFVHQYISIVQRIAKLESETIRNKNDIDKLYLFLKNHVILKGEQDKE